MWPFRSAPKAKPQRFVDLENALDEHDAAIKYLRQALKELNARVSSVQRWAKPAQDAPSEAIEEQPDIQPWAPPPTVSTAHLARRFRGV